MKGKLIVIDGSDGVGKTTQTALLISRLQKEGKKAKTLKFPQYDANFFGELIKKCLVGEHGNFIAVDPHIVSVLYAVDRWESKKKLESWLKAGNTVVLDRYVSGSQIHQGGKIRNAKKRKEFSQWLDEMEYEIFGMPRPDLIVYLHLSTALSKQLIKKRGGADLADKNHQYLSNSEESALKIIRSGANWKKVECAARGAILPREVIHDRIWKEVKKLLH